MIALVGCIGSCLIVVGFYGFWGFYLLWFGVGFLWHVFGLALGFKPC